MSGRPPVVYIGPSLPLDAARAILPGADLRAPVRRGDLYRDRTMGAGILVVIDGVFFQEQAIPPREVIDVVRDGALVVGASSMGALRAAECWPAGMEGAGLVYRLFRAGVLESDDEVAVAFDPEGGPGASSVPLVNVRWAVRRARLARDEAGRIVRAAAGLYFPERRWDAILAAAGVDLGLEPRLARFDLKAADATRALERVARRLAADPGLPRRLARATDAPFVPSERRRERPHDPLEGLDPAGVRRDLARWMLGSGRWARHLEALAAAGPAGDPPSSRAAIEVDLHVARSGAPGTEDGRRWLERRGHDRSRLERAARARRAAVERVRALVADETAFADALWAALELAGELDAEIVRMRAVGDAARLSVERGLAPRAIDRHLAASEIEAAAAGGLEAPAALVGEAADRLARAKRVREILFGKSRI